MCIPLPTVVSVTFYSVRRIRSAQIISRSFEIVAPFRFARLFFLSFSVFFLFIVRGTIIDYRILSKTSFQLRETRILFLSDGFRHEISISLFLPIDTMLPVTLRIMWRSVVENRLAPCYSDMTDIRPIAFPSSQS